MAHLGKGMLPLVAVSRYTKVSVRAMDIETPLAQTFIIVILLPTVAVFIVMCVLHADLSDSTT